MTSRKFRMSVLFKLAGVLATLLLGACASDARTLRFSGHEWTVKSGTRIGPGPNDWDESNVWVDTRGDLHLKIVNRGGHWSCAQLMTKERLGFGTYQFELVGRVDQLDANVVLGLFDHPTADVGPDGTDEIDIEFAKWGRPEALIGNYTVWPARKGPDRVFQRFPLALTSDATTHRFVWNARSVSFQSLGGHRDDNANILAQWRFAPGDPASQVAQQPQPVEISLWLFKGDAPRDGREVEVIVHSFKFTP